MRGFINDVLTNRARIARECLSPWNAASASFWLTSIGGLMVIIGLFPLIPRWVGYVGALPLIVAGVGGITSNVRELVSIRGNRPMEDTVLVGAMESENLIAPELGDEILEEARESGDQVESLLIKKALAWNSRLRQVKRVLLEKSTASVLQHLVPAIAGIVVLLFAYPIGESFWHSPFGAEVPFLDSLEKVIFAVTFLGIIGMVGLAGFFLRELAWIAGGKMQPVDMVRGIRRLISNAKSSDHDASRLVRLMATRMKFRMSVSLAVFAAFVMGIGYA